MKKIFATVLALLLLVGLVAAAEQSNYRMGTIFDPISRKNIPYWKLSEERLQELLESENLNSIKWNRNRDIPRSPPKIHTGRVLGKEVDYAVKDTPIAVEKEKRFSKSFTGKSVTPKKTLNKRVSQTTNRRLINPPDVGKRKGKYMSTEELVEAFGLTEIYDPAFNRFIDANKISKQRIIEYLNNPESQEMTFGEKVDEAKAKIEELGIQTRTRHYNRGLKTQAQPGQIISRRVYERSGETVILKSLEQGKISEKVTI